jgi:hypothetical protein
MRSAGIVTSGSIFLATLLCALAVSATTNVPVAEAHCSVDTGFDIQNANDPNQAGAVVNYPAPTTTGDPCGTVTCSPPSGSFFPVGTTTVTCTASAAGSPSDAFHVTIIDTQPPNLPAPFNITTSTAPGFAVRLVNYPTPIASDNVPGVTVSCSPPSGSLFDARHTPVTCTAVDSAGNKTVKVFDVNVVDTENPTITAPADVLVTAAAGDGFAKVNFPDPTIADNVAGVTSTCSPASGSNFLLGDTTVTCTAKDVQGNTASANFVVRVRAPLALIQLAQLTNRTFAVGGRGAAFTAAAKRGTLFRFVLTDPGRMTITIEQRRGGRKVRYQRRGALTLDAKRGLNEVRFNGRIANKALKPGRYRAVLVAHDFTGRASVPRRLAFRVVKPK